MLDLLAFIAFGVFAVYSTYISWCRPKLLRQFLENIYSDAWPNAQAFAKSGFAFWIARISTLLMLIAFLIGIVGLIWNFIQKVGLNSNV